MKSVKLAALSMLLATPVLALEPIGSEAHIREVLTQGFIADKIADTCPTLGPRKLRGLNELIKLRDYALKKGYKADEIRAFVENKDEKARGRARAADWLAKAGAVDSDPESFCRIGRDEISRKTLVGALLRDEA